MMITNYCQWDTNFKFNLIKYLLQFIFPKSAARFIIRTSKLKMTKPRMLKSSCDHAGLSAQRSTVDYGG